MARVVSRAKTSGGDGGREYKVTFRNYPKQPHDEANHGSGQHTVRANSAEEAFKVHQQTPREVLYGANGNEGASKQVAVVSRPGHIEGAHETLHTYKAYTGPHFDEGAGGGKWITINGAHVFLKD